MDLLKWFTFDKNLKSQGIDTSIASVYNGTYSFTGGKLTEKSLKLGSGTIQFNNPFVNRDAWSLAFWYKANTPAIWRDIFTVKEKLQRVEFSSVNAQRLTWYANSLEAIFTNGTVLADNLSDETWYHIVITFNKGVSTFYLNGEQKVRQTGRRTFNNVEDVIYWGSRIDNAYCDINLQDIKCYDYALNLREIKNLSQALSIDYTFEAVRGDWVANDAGYLEHRGILHSVAVEDALEASGSKKASFKPSLESRVEIPNITLGSSFTVGGWVKWDAFNNWSRFFDFGTASSGLGYALGIANSSTSSTIKVFGRGGAGTSGLSSAGDLNFFTAEKGRWYHLMLVVNGTNLKAYKNGQKLIDTTIYDVTNQTYLLSYLGKSNWSADSYFKGNIARFSIYQSALSEEDIQRLYKNTISIQGNTEELICNCFGEGDKIAVNRGGSLFGVSFNEFPVDYLHYAKSTGQQWVDLGYTPAGKICRLVLDAEFESIGNSLEVLVGASKTSEFSIGAYAGDRGWCPKVGDGYAFCNTWKKSDLNSRHIFELQSSGEFKIDGESYSNLWDAPIYSFALPSQTLYLFANHNDQGATDSTTGMKFYSLKIYEDATLVHHYVPALKDGQVYIYDKKTKTYISSSTSLIAGPKKAIITLDDEVIETEKLIEY